MSKIQIHLDISLLSVKHILSFNSTQIQNIRLTTSLTIN
jgi:hypothetical protein